MNLKFGRFEINSRGMYWDMMKLHNPFRILWNLLLLPFYYVGLGIFCIILAAISLDLDAAKDVWQKHNIFFW